MIKFASAARWGLRALLLLLLLSGLVLLWVDRQLQRFAGAGTVLVDPSTVGQRSKLTAIIGVHVLSVDGETMLPEHTVVFDGQGIRDVGAALEPPEGAKIVDGRGLFLIPGLVDAHVHLKHSPNDLLVFVASGVTGVREMSGNSDHLRWRDEIEAGRLGPRLFVASEKLESRGWLAGQFQRWTRNRLNVRTPQDAEALVRSLGEQGYDAVKLGSVLDAPTYAQLAEAAREADIPLIGHLPVSVSLQALWSSGQSELAHIEEIAKALDAEFGYFDSSNAEEYLRFVGERSDDVASRLAQHSIAVVSSLWLIESIARQKVAPAELLAGIELTYANPGLVEGTPLSKGWLPGHNAYELSPESSAAQREAAVAYWTAFAEAHRILLRALRDHGVQIMAGTDANTAGVVPGFSLHDELQALHRAGLSPPQTLRTATVVPADRMGHSAGRISPGSRADLLLLRANPLQDIRHTRAIEAVIVDGQYLDRSDLDDILERVAQANQASRNIPLPSGAGRSEPARSIP
jgi:hypothetical protein